MRNGVIAIHRDGTLALMNDEAYRIFSLTRRGSNVARPFSEVFRERPDLIRVLSGVALGEKIVTDGALFLKRELESH